MNVRTAGVLLSAALFSCSPPVPDIPPAAPTVTRTEALRTSRAYTNLAWRGTRPQRPAWNGSRRDQDRHSGRLRIRRPCGSLVEARRTVRGHAVQVGRVRYPAAIRQPPEPRPGKRRPPRRCRRHGHPGKAGGGRRRGQQVCRRSRLFRFRLPVLAPGPRPWSTRELPSLCTPLDWEELRTGDILIVPGRHVLMFIEWHGDGRDVFLGSEAGPLPVWKCAEHFFSRAILERGGYRPMRYKGMREQETDSGTAKP